MPQLPSAGCVWLPKVTVPFGRIGLSARSPSAVVGKTPSSPSTVARTFLPELSRTSTGKIMYRR